MTVANAAQAAARSGVQVDFITADNRGAILGHGPVALKLLQSGFNVNALRTNDVLRKDEWSQIDNVLVEIARKRLVAVGELRSRGQTFSIGNGLGTTILEWENVSDMEPAQVSMSGVTQGEQDTMEFNLQSMPLPIIHKDFTINIRKLEASRTTGQSLDTAQTAMATTLVAEQIEQMIFLGEPTRVGTARIFGLLTEPNRNTGSVTADWDVTATGEQMVDDIISMVAAAQADFMFGPYGIFVPYAAFNRMQDDFKTNSDKTILERLLAIEGIQFIRPSSDVTAGAVVMYQTTSDVVDEVIGLEPTIVQWETQGGMMVHFKVMAIMIPRVRATQTLQSGVVHFS